MSYTKAKSAKLSLFLCPSWMLFYDYQCSSFVLSSRVGKRFPLLSPPQCQKRYMEVDPWDGRRPAFSVLSHRHSHLKPTSARPLCPVKAVLELHNLQTYLHTDRLTLGQPRCPKCFRLEQCINCGTHL